MKLLDQLKELSNQYIATDPDEPIQPSLRLMAASLRPKAAIGVRWGVYSIEFNLTFELGLHL